MKTKILPLFLLIAVTILCVAGAKIIRLPLTTTFSSNAVFAVSSGTGYTGRVTYRIEAHDLARGLGPWITNSGSGGGAANIYTNANQFGAAGATLTLKTGALTTNAVIYSSAISQIPLTLNAIAGQDGNMLNVKDSSGNVMFAIGYDGVMAGVGAYSARLAATSTAGDVWTAGDTTGIGAFAAPAQQTNSSIVRQTQLTAASNALVNLLVSYDTTTSNGLYALIIGGGITAATATNISQYFATNSAIITSNALLSTLVANDTTTSNALWAAKMNGQTNANQFGASTVLTIKSDVELTNAYLNGINVLRNGSQIDLQGSSSFALNTADASSLAGFSAGKTLGSVPNVSLTEAGYLDGVSSSIQTQLDNKQPLTTQLTILASQFTNVYHWNAATNIVTAAASLPNNSAVYFSAENFPVTASILNSNLVAGSAFSGVTLANKTNIAFFGWPGQTVIAGTNGPGEQWFNTNCSGLYFYGITFRGYTNHNFMALPSMSGGGAYLWASVNNYKIENVTWDNCFFAGGADHGLQDKGAEGTNSQQIAATWVISTNNINVRNSRFQDYGGLRTNVSGGSISADGTAIVCTGWTIDGNTFVGNFRDVEPYNEGDFEAAVFRNCVIRNNEFINTAAESITFAGSTNGHGVAVLNNTFRWEPGATFHGTNIYTTGIAGAIPSAIVMNGGRDHLIRGNVIRSAGKYGITVNSSASMITDVSIIGNFIYGVTNGTDAGYGIFAGDPSLTRVFSVQRLLVQGNTVENCKNQAILFMGVSDSTIEGNQLWNPAFPGDTAALHLYTSTSITSNTVVRNNTIHDPGTAQMGYGIQIGAGVLGTVLEGNKIEGAVTGPINDLATAGQTRYRNQINSIGMLQTDGTNLLDYVRLRNIATNSILLVGANSNLVAGTIGSGLALTAGTLSATGGGSGGTNFPPVINQLGSTNIAVGVGVRQAKHLTTNASFALVFTGTPLNGEEIRLGVSNTASSVIYLTNTAGIYDPTVGSNVTTFAIGSTSMRFFSFVNSTNANLGVARWELVSTLGKHVELAVGGAILNLHTNSAGSIVTISNSYIPQASSMVLSNIVGLSSTVFTNVPLGGTNISVRTTGGTNFIDTTGQLNNWASFTTNVWNSRQGGDAVLTNLVGTVGNNVTNENSTALQINSGTLTLTPGVVSNLVASSIGIPAGAGNIISNIQQIKFKAAASPAITTSNLLINFNTNRYFLTGLTNAIFTNLVEESTSALDTPDTTVFIKNTTGVTMGLVWPAYGAQHGYFIRTNANNPVISTTSLAAGAIGVANITVMPDGTNMFLTFTTWP